MSLPSRVATLLCCIAALGCAKNYGSTFDPLAIFPATATWSWNDSINKLPDDPTMVRLDIDRIIRDTCSKGFADRGYVEVTPGSTPDYLLSYHVGLGRVFSASKAEAVGTVTMTLMEADTERKVWQGFIETEVNTALSDSDRRTGFQYEMEDLMADFPPSQPD